MKQRMWPLSFALTVLGIVPLSTGAQSIYTPYAFTNFAGQPGAPGGADGTGNAAQFYLPHSVAVDWAYPSG